jgi:hypothetical protein
MSTSTAQPETLPGGYPYPPKGMSLSAKAEQLRSMLFRGTVKNPTIRSMYRNHIAALEQEIQRRRRPKAAENGDPPGKPLPRRKRREF